MAMDKTRIMLLLCAFLFLSSGHMLHEQALMQNKLKELNNSIDQIIRMDRQALLSKQSDISGNIEQRLNQIETRLGQFEQVFGAITVNEMAKSLHRGTDEYYKVQTIDTAHSPVVGNSEAPITIVEFVDFECPFCARYHSVLPELVELYPDKVNYVIKNYPLTFQKQAVPAAKAALAANEQGKYEQMVEAIFRNQKELSSDLYIKLAGEIGLDVEQFKKDLKEKDSLWADYIKKDLVLGNKLGVRGTPTMFINGRKTPARDLPGFLKELESLIDTQSL